MNTTEPAILAEGLAKHYRQTIAVADVSLRVEAGETFGILGANGAGKTTTVEMIAGLRAPDRGRVRVLGLDPRRDRARVRQVLGVQLQQAYLHGALRVSELLELYRSFYPNPRPAAELLDMVALDEQRGTRFEKLSGGQQQRLSIALALAGRPSPAMVLIAQVVVSVIQAVFGIALALTVAAVAFGANPPVHLGVAVGVGLLAMLAMYSVGMMVAAVAPTPNSAVAIGLIVFFAFGALGGMFGGRDALPEPLTTLGGVVAALLFRWE
ncbi:ATP-binding cassette domain-containing protein [Agromyces silvae]|uniref:ATP-binding cassette domain-containing protein n=1 Tax=Agromyces silvae TaxID=3388266 RepID=UPI00280A8E7F|nr:ATP-binding cassette domain-containing protein [Agromyces protaetiae]